MKVKFLEVCIFAHFHKKFFGSGNITIFLFIHKNIGDTWKITGNPTWGCKPQLEDYDPTP